MLTACDNTSYSNISESAVMSESVASILTTESNNEDPLSLNLYTYCHNNPIIYQDKNGHWIHLAVGAFIGAAVSGLGQVVSKSK